MRTRHFFSNIDGSQPDNGSSLDLTTRFVTNNVEQLVLFGMAVACFALIDPNQAAVVLPVMGLWFAIARGCFILDIGGRRLQGRSALLRRFIRPLACSFIV